MAGLLSRLEAAHTERSPSGGWNYPTLTDLNRERALKGATPVTGQSLLEAVDAQYGPPVYDRYHGAGDKQARANIAEAQHWFVTGRLNDPSLPGRGLRPPGPPPCRADWETN